MFATLRDDITKDLRANGFPRGRVAAFLLAYAIHAGFYLLVNYRLTRILYRDNKLFRLFARLREARVAAKTGCAKLPIGRLGVSLRSARLGLPGQSRSERAEAPHRFRQAAHRHQVPS